MNDLVNFQNGEIDQLSDDQIGKIITEMEKRKFYNEKNNHNEYHSFSDIDLILYYIYRNKNLIREDASLSDNTKKSYRTTLVQFRNILFNLLTTDNSLHDSEINIFKSVEKRHVVGYLEILKRANLSTLDKKYKNSTITTKGSISLQFLRWLVKVNIVNSEVLNDLPSLALSSADRPDRDLQHETVKLILDELKENPYKFSIVLCLATTGLRCEALSNIKMSDISKKRVHGKLVYVISVREKGNKIRKATVYPELFENFLLPRRRRNQSLAIGKDAPGFLFENNRGKKYSSAYLSNAISKWMHELHILTKQKYPNNPEKIVPDNISAHHFRHSYAMYLYEYTDANIYDIQAGLQHESIKTTKIYLSNILSEENDTGTTLNPSDFLAD